MFATFFKRSKTATRIAELAATQVDVALAKYRELLRATGKSDALGDEVLSQLAALHKQYGGGAELDELSQAVATHDAAVLAANHLPAVRAGYQSLGAKLELHRGKMLKARFAKQDLSAPERVQNQLVDEKHDAATALAECSQALDRAATIEGKYPQLFDGGIGPVTAERRAASRRRYIRHAESNPRTEDVQTVTIEALMINGHLLARSQGEQTTGTRLDALSHFEFVKHPSQSAEEFRRLCGLAQWIASGSGTTRYLLAAEDKVPTGLDARAVRDASILFEDQASWRERGNVPPDVQLLPPPGVSEREHQRRLAALEAVKVKNNYRDGHVEIGV
jgi:hypothetical protein